MQWGDEGKGLTPLPALLNPWHPHCMLRPRWEGRAAQPQPGAKVPVFHPFLSCWKPVTTVRLQGRGDSVLLLSWCRAGVSRGVQSSSPATKLPLTQQSQTLAALRTHHSSCQRGGDSRGSSWQWPGRTDKRGKSERVKSSQLDSAAARGTMLCRHF